MSHKLFYYFHVFLCHLFIYLCIFLCFFFISRLFLEDYFFFWRWFFCFFQILSACILSPSSLFFLVKNSIDPALLALCLTIKWSRIDLSVCFFLSLLRRCLLFFCLLVLVRVIHLFICFLDYRSISCFRRYVVVMTY